MKSNNNFFSLIAFVLLTLLVVQNVSAETITLNPEHPQQYTVKKGDTLWDISATFLNKPWLWPEIWHLNDQIANPHLIYPGDVLRLIYIDGKPYITRDKHGKRTVRLSPKTRVESLDQAIPTIPLDIIDSYLTKNRILTPNEFATAPYIVGINDGHLSAGADNMIYVMDIVNESTDNRYGIYRRGKSYINPNNKRDILGYEAIYLGEGLLEKQGSPDTVYVKKSKSEILTGHYVIGIDEDSMVDATFMPVASTMQGSARIIGVLTAGMHPGVNLVGAMDVVVIDAGLEDGVEIGNVFNIYKKGVTVKDPKLARQLIKLPDEEAGNLMVFRPFNRLSYALVMDAQNVLRVGDIVKSPFAGE